jgi:hypothetical protein
MSSGWSSWAWWCKIDRLAGQEFARGRVPRLDLRVREAPQDSRPNRLSLGSQSPRQYECLSPKFLGLGVISVQAQVALQLHQCKQSDATIGGSAIGADRHRLTRQRDGAPVVISEVQVLGIVQEPNRNLGVVWSVHASPQLECHRQVWFRPLAESEIQVRPTDGAPDDNIRLRLVLKLIAEAC